MWKDTGFPEIEHLNGRTAEGRAEVVFVIPKGVGDCEGQGVAFVGLFLDGCHYCFHSHHGVESESQIVKLLYLLQECGQK